MEEEKPNPPSQSQSSKKPFSQFLIDSDNSYLALIGKSIQYFGLKEVGSFLLGAVAVFLYAFFTQTLPFVKPVPAAPAEAKQITVHGSVQTLQGKPLDAFEVAVITTQAGPFRAADGTFTISVPRKDKYSVLVWAPGYYPINVYGDLDLIQEGDEFKLPPLLGFPANLGLVQGTVLDPAKRPISGFVTVQGKMTQIENDGSFQLLDIPLGRLKLSVAKKPNQPPIHEEDIEVNPMGPTPIEVTVAARQ